MDAIIRAAALSGVAHRLERGVRPPAEPAPPAAAEAQAREQEQSLLTAQAEMILEAARAEAELAAAALRAEAELRGYEEGLARGEEAGRAPLDVQREHFAALAAGLVRAKAAVLADAEDAMIELAFAAVCKLVGEHAASAAGVAAMVRQHSARRHEREQVVVRLHPDDFALLQGGDDGLADHCRADAGIELGGCIVDSGSGSLDARLETQLTRLRDTLLTVRAERAAGVHGDGAPSGKAAG